MLSFKKVKNLQNYNDKKCFILTGNYVRKIFSKTLIIFEIMTGLR